MFKRCLIQEDADRAHSETLKDVTRQLSDYCRAEKDHMHFSRSPQGKGPLLQPEINGIITDAPRVNHLQCKLDTGTSHSLA